MSESSLVKMASEAGYLFGPGAEVPLSNGVYLSATHSAMEGEVCRRCGKLVQAFRPVELEGAIGNVFRRLGSFFYDPAKEYDQRVPVGISEWHFFVGEEVVCWVQVDASRYFLKQRRLYLVVVDPVFPGKFTEGGRETALGSRLTDLEFAQLRLDPMSGTVVLAITAEREAEARLVLAQRDLEIASFEQAIDYCFVDDDDDMSSEESVEQVELVEDVMCMLDDMGVTLPSSSDGSQDVVGEFEDDPFVRGDDYVPLVMEDDDSDRADVNFVFDSVGQGGCALNVGFTSCTRNIRSATDTRCCRVYDVYASNAVDVWGGQAGTDVWLWTGAAREFYKRQAVLMFSFPVPHNSMAVESSVAMCDGCGFGWSVCRWLPVGPELEKLLGCVAVWKPLAAVGDAAVDMLLAVHSYRCGMTSRQQNEFVRSVTQEKLCQGYSLFKTQHMFLSTDKKHVTVFRVLMGILALADIEAAGLFLFKLVPYGFYKGVLKPGGAGRSDNEPEKLRSAAFAGGMVLKFLVTVACVDVPELRRDVVNRVNQVVSVHALTPGVQRGCGLSRPAADTLRARLLHGIVNERKCVGLWLRAHFPSLPECVAAYWDRQVGIVPVT